LNSFFALDVLGLNGFVLFTNSNGVYLGDAVLEPVYEELERRETVEAVSHTDSTVLINGETRTRTRNNPTGRKTRFP
jgi:hypothetical protein